MKKLLFAFMLFLLIGGFTGSAYANDLDFKPNDICIGCVSQQPNRSDSDFKPNDVCHGCFPAPTWVIPDFKPNDVCHGCFPAPTWTGQDF